MKKDAKSLKAVAEHCTRFSPNDCKNCDCSNSTASGVTCKNCKHYEEKDVCDLDLYQEIMKNHHL